MSMPRKSTTHQFDLFSNQPVTTTVRVPAWQALPGETRRRLIRLMVNLISSITSTALAPCSRRAWIMMHEKIRPHHLERKALLYVRQSPTGRAARFNTRCAIT
jgi:hypothetical protein